MIPETINKELPKTFQEIEEAMKNCEQTHGQSVLEHGQSVWKYLSELIDWLKGGELTGWRLPDWLIKNKKFILDNLPGEGKLKNYAIYHDIGKPYCRYVEDGKVHFPGHQEVSAYIWLIMGLNDRVRLWIGNDMVIHTSTAEQI